MSGKTHIQTITIIGSGNVAYHYAKAMSEHNFIVKTICSRSTFAPQDLQSDLIVIAVKDEAIESVATKIGHTNSILVHTSGFVATDCLAMAAENYGSLYPLQSLKKEKETDFSTVPLCTFANNESTAELLRDFALTLSPIHYDLSDSQRKTLHLAAVFANNFTNHLFGIAKRILDRENIPFSTLFPLMDTTLERAKQGNPFCVQTGPAFRGEQSIMAQHKAKLSQDEKAIYDVLSKDIIHEHKKEK